MRFFSGYYTNILALLLHFFLGVKNALQWLWHRISFWEPIFWLSMLVQYITLSWGWRHYTISFGENMYFNEKIITDDFFLFFLLLSATFLPVFFLPFKKQCSSFYRRISLWWRIIFLAIITLLYTANIIWPQRIAFTPIASYTPAFFLFGAFLFLSWFSGIKAVQNYQ